MPERQVADFVRDGYTVGTLSAYADAICWTVADMMESRPLDYKTQRDLLWYALGEIANGLTQLTGRTDG